MTDVPPLEDISPLLNKIKLQEELATSKTKGKTGKNSITSKAESNSPFAGMKKGFLFQDSKKKSKMDQTQSHSKKREKDIPFIKKHSGDSELVIKEVQDAMTADSFSKFQDTLSSKIESDETVSHILSDPAWLAILDEFQTDPEKATRKYKDNPEVRQTMTKLCSVFGDTFLHLDRPNRSEEEDLSGKMMENPELKDTLTDPYVERIMHHMKNGENDKVHRMLQMASHSEREKIKLLVDFGLFSFVS